MRDYDTASVQSEPVGVDLLGRPDPVNITCSAGQTLTQMTRCKAGNRVSTIVQIHCFATQGRPADNGTVMLNQLLRRHARVRTCVPRGGRAAVIQAATKRAPQFPARWGIDTDAFKCGLD